jgi:hypothetical protein
MSVKPIVLIQWINSLPANAKICIDEGGLSLQVVNNPKIYLEVGGQPEEETIYRPKKLIPVSNKIIKLRRLARELHYALCDIHPSWNECESCSETMKQAAEAQHLNKVTPLRKIITNLLKEYKIFAPKDKSFLRSYNTI